jgi:Rieske Fe-S protein
MYPEDKKKHDKRRYRKIIFRVRRESDLDGLLATYRTEGDTSVNFMITEALCKHLGCELPHREYSTYTRRRIV